jgi:DnaJ-class molecular chaperone
VIFSNYYGILGIRAGASQEEIAQAYRRLARQHHPDLQPPERKGWAEEQMKQLNEAYAVLNDSQARARYDISFWRYRAALSRIRRGGSRRWRGFAARVKTTIGLLAVSFLVLGLWFYLFDWNQIFSGMFTAGQMLALRWAFAQFWVAVLVGLLYTLRR